MLSYRWCLCLLILLFFSPILAEPVPDEIYALLNDGRYDEAEQRLRNDLKIMEKSRQGPYIELLAEVLHVQSEILISQGRAEEAYRKAKESVELNETVEGLCSLGKTFNIQLKLDEAIRYYRQALRLSDQLHGKHSPWSATVRTHLGLALTGTGDYPEALETYLELPPDSMPDRPLYLSYLYQELGQTDEALRQARMALEVVSALPEGGEFLARTILVTCLLNEGELEEAEEEMRLLVPSLPGYTEFQIVMLKTDLATQRGQLSEAEQLLSSLELPESEVLRARLLEERAKLAIARDKPTEAGMLLEEAVSLRGESSVEPHIWLQLGEIALLSGDPEKALDYADRAVDRARRRYGARHLKAASTLHRAADLYQVVGRGDKTEAALRASLDIYRETIGEEASLSQLVQTKLSLYELAIGKPLAEKSLKRCLAVAQTLSPEGKAQIEVLACLGLAQSLEGEEAVSMLERGLSAAEGPSRQPYLASLANTNLKAGNLEKARGYAETMVQSGGPPLFQATAYTMLAETHLAEPQKAIEYFQKALELDADSPLSLFTRVGLAGTYLDQRRPELALPVLREALAQTDRFVSSNGSETLVNARAVETLLTLGQGEEALKVADDSLARNLKKIIARQTAGDLAGLPPEKTRKLESFNKRLLSIEQALSATDPLELGRRAKERKLLEEREELLDRKKALLTELSSAYPRYSELVAPTPLDLASFQAVLGPDELALLYYLGPRSFLFLVSADELRYTEIASAVEINKLAERYNRSLGSGKLNRSVALEPLEPEKQADTLDEDTAALSKILLDPLRGNEELVAGRSLIIVPTQSLWMVPFESLPGLRGSKFLVQERSLTYSPSLSLLVRYRRLESGRSSARKALVLGGAEYGEKVAPLPYAALEAETVAARWSKSALFTGLEATESAYLGNPERQSSQLIHFATHGVLGEHPALLLTPDEGDDGRLDMGEILAAPIDAEIVTLSACSSGRGWVKPGEGVIGLSRAFLHAGASSVMVSLWNVNDQSTFRLMSSFYEHLENLGPSKALRKAQLEMIEAGAPLHQWAPFVVVGTR